MFSIPINVLIAKGIPSFVIQKPCMPALLLRLLLLAIVAAAAPLTAPQTMRLRHSTQQTNRPWDMASRRRWRRRARRKAAVWPRALHSCLAGSVGPHPPSLCKVPPLLRRHPLCVTDCLLMFAFATLLHKLKINTFPWCSAFLSVCHADSAHWPMGVGSDRIGSDGYSFSPESQSLELRLPQKFCKAENFVSPNWLPLIESKMSIISLQSSLENFKIGSHRKFEDAFIYRLINVHIFKIFRLQFDF